MSNIGWMSGTRSALGLWVAVISICVGSLGCKPASTRDKGGPNAAMAGPPPVEVDVVTAALSEVIDNREFTGRTVAIESVVVRARVSGYLLQHPRRSRERSPGQSDGNLAVENRDTQTKANQELEFQVLVHEGERVSVGTPLFEIDPEPYRLALAQAQGNLVAAEAQLQRLFNERERIVELSKSNAISKSDLDLAIANYQEASAQIENLKATRDRAELDLSFTQVRSPIEGIVGRSALTQGNLITADTTELTTIVSVSPIHVYFDIDESSFLDYRHMLQPGMNLSDSSKEYGVEMALARDTNFPYRGKIDFLNNRTDPETGNTTLRAVFENEMGKLSPGLFARVRVPFSNPYRAIIIPTRGLSMDQQGRYVMTIDADGVVQERQSVRIGTAHGNKTVILDGLTEGDRVVVSGLQKIKPGAKVSPKAYRDVERESAPLNTEASNLGEKVKP